jgi:hypothetical protein
MSGLLLGTVGVRPALSSGFDVQRIPSEQSASRKLARNGLVGNYSLQVGLCGLIRRYS